MLDNDACNFFPLWYKPSVGHDGIFVFIPDTAIFLYTAYTLAVYTKRCRVYCKITNCFCAMFCCVWSRCSTLYLVYRSRAAKKISNIRQCRLYLSQLNHEPKQQVFFTRRLFVYISTLRQDTYVAYVLLQYVCFVGNLVPLYYLLTLYSVLV